MPDRAWALTYCSEARRGAVVEPSHLRLMLGPCELTAHDATPPETSAASTTRHAPPTSRSANPHGQKVGDRQLDAHAGQGSIRARDKPPRGGSYPGEATFSLD